ncbi:unnamed protein product [Bursaphelenchus xylophilus]|uniref:(pine wood nematode) hypothetical protein n=1 Tax=Bursaphelenchus xylophilus TaxID=6326 RepID=A0A1I7RNM9_BURXY|nr:unnamed protein product [Bursaphelenchus xylophilus]CAG9124169.1 unnamed protein product [Bursaphelenchus xylophilus]
MKIRTLKLAKKPVKIEKLAGFTLILLLRYAIPKATAEYDNLLVNSVTNDNITPQTRTSCAQGVFNQPINKCECDEGWGGENCEICTRKPCIPKARISTVRPKLNPKNETKVIEVVGVGFPRNHDKSYECLFNETKTVGRWVNSTIVECLRPEVNKDQAYSIVLLPTGLHSVIKAQESIFLDYYDECDNQKCQGTCFKSLCVCKDANTGDQCQDPKASVNQQCPGSANRTLDLETEEMEALSYMITPNTTEKTILLSTSEPDLSVDELSRRISWDKPLGNTQPYTMDIQVQKPFCSEYIKVSLVVNHTYTPQLTSVTRHKHSNMHRITGFIKYSNTTTLQNLDVPVVIKIYEKDALIEEATTWSQRRFFSYDVYPFTGNVKEYHITADHPHPASNSTPGLPFSHCTVDALYDGNVVVTEQDFEVKYELKSQSCACGEWMAEVIWPRQLVMMRSQKISRDVVNPTIELVLRADQKAKDSFEYLYVAISCDYLVTYTARHHLIRRFGNLIKINPERLDIVVGDEDTLVEVTLEMQQPPTSMSSSTSDNLSPFFLVSPPTSRRLNNKTVQMEYVFGVQSPLKEQTLEGILRYPSEKSPVFQIPYRVTKGSNADFKLRVNVKCMTYSENKFAEVLLISHHGEQLFNKFVKINSAVEFQPLPIGVFELIIRAEDFQTFTALVKVNTLNSSFTAILTQKLSKSLTLFDDGVRFIQMDSQSTRPELIVEPSTITEVDKDIWVSFIYSNGPQNSMAMITTQASSGEYYDIENLPYHMAICVGCGYKHKIRVVSNEKRMNETDVVHLLQIPYIYTVPGVMGDFQDQALIMVDLRSKRVTPPRIYPSNSNIQRFYQISQSCHTDLAMKCRQFFVRADFCSSSWSLLNANIPSSMGFMESILFKRNCSQSGLDFYDLKQLLRCVISANSGFCEVQPYITDEHLACTQNSLSLANKKNLYNMAAIQLNLPRFDLCNFVNGFYKHLHYLTTLLPSNSSLQTESQFEKFLKTIVNESDYQDYITLQEGLSFQESSQDLLFISKWNKVFEQAQELEMNPFRNFITNSSAYRYLEEFQRLTRMLKELSSGISKRDPSSLLNDVISLMLRLENRTSEVVLESYLKVEPLYSKESGVFLVNLHLHNPTTSITLRKIITTVKFTDFNGTQYDFPIKEQLFDGRPSSAMYKILKPGENITIQWTVSSKMPLRLLRTVYPTAVVKLNFEADRQFHSREIYSPTFKMDPAGSIRILAFMYPLLYGRIDGKKDPFNIKLSVMNVGYLPLRNVQLINIRPQVTDENFTGALPFTLDSMEIDEMTKTPSLDVDLGKIESGQQKNVVMNISLTKAGMGFLKNIRVSCSSNNQFVDNVVLRKFYIKHMINPTALLVADIAEVYPLYLYQTDSAKLTSLEALFVDQETPVASERECLKIIMMAFRMADEEKKFESPLIGTAPWPNDINSTMILKAVVQVFPNFDVLHRTIPSSMIWVDDKKLINFVDSSPFTNAQKIYYEFIFSSAECAAQKFFAQEEYRIPVPPGLHSKYSILAQIQALGDQYTYSLKSQQKNFPYAILGDSGSIINMYGDIEGRGFCAVIEAEDSSGGRFNSSVQLGGERVEHCGVKEDEKMQDHTLGGVYNIPFDYQKARNEFLHKSVANVPPIPIYEDNVNVEVDENEVIYELEPDNGLTSTEIPTSTVTTKEEVVLPAQVGLLPDRITGSSTPTTTASTTTTTYETSTSSATTSTETLSTTTPDTSETNMDSTLPVRPDATPQIIHQMTPHPTPQMLTTTTIEPLQTPHITLEPAVLTTTVFLEPDDQLSHVNQSQWESVIPPLKETEGITVTTTAGSTTSGYEVYSRVTTAYRANQSTTTEDDLLVNLITISTLPTTSALPVATGIHIDTKQTGSFSLKDQINLGDAAAMVDMACKMKGSKPAYRVLCDLAKTVYRTH